MKISHKLVYGYLLVAILVSCAGYLYVKIYNDIKLEVIKLNKYSLVKAGSSNEVLLVMEKCQESVQDLINKKYRIVYTLPDKHFRKGALNQKSNIKSDLNRLEHFLSAPIDPARTAIYPVENNKIEKEEQVKEWVNLRKKDFYYHWKYLSHFINLSDKAPDQAYDFFKKTLEPHYRKNIYPVIDRHREKAHEEMEDKLAKIIGEYIPNASTTMVGLTVVTLFTVVFLGFGISRSVSKPIIKLTDAARKIGQGQLDTRIDIKTNDEVGVLANAFNQMTYNLSKTTVSKSYVDNIIKSMLDTLIVINPDATIIKVNQSTLNLLGYERDEIIGRSLKSIIVEELLENSTVIDELISTSVVANVEMTYLAKDNTKIPVLFSGSVMYDNDDEIQGIVCVALDIGERKKAEGALRKAHHELEQRVEERTIDLSNANRQLTVEIKERREIEEVLRESRNRLRMLSSHILAAQEKERKRISLELHDDMGQSLSLLKIQISSIKRKLRKDQSLLISECEQILQYTDSVIENVRRLSRDLRPSILEDLGLSAAMQWLIGDFAKYYDIDTSIDIENIDNFFSPEQQITIYRIFQETFTNIEKHAQAEHVSVAIKNQGEKILFTIEDDGRGFNIGEFSFKDATEKGMGLAAMRERARMLGSSLDILTRNGEGTRITFAVPVNEGDCRH